MDEQAASDVFRRIEANVAKVIVGKAGPCRSALVALAAGGHLLIEDVPGTGKTMLAKAVARSLDAKFKRVQFTPDLLPSDVTGVSIFNQKTASFEFRPGPIFTEILLADEINRATPRTQSALLEAMEERQVTSDGATRTIPGLFFVLATENPVEQQGTFPLPEAQLDRFIVQIGIGYPPLDDEVQILGRQQLEHPIEKLVPVATTAEVLDAQTVVRKVHVADDVKRYMVEIVQATRRHRDVLLGASPRGSLCLMRASQAYALFEGEHFIKPIFVKNVAPDVLSHRIIVNPQARLGGVTPAKVVRDVLERVPVPVRVGA